MSKSKKKYKGFPCKLNSDQIYRGFSYIFFRGPINLLEIFHLNLKAISIFCWTIILLRVIFQESKVKGIFFSWIRFILFRLKEYTLAYPRAAGPRAWRDAWGEPRQENQKTEIRKRTGKEIEKERKIRKTNAISYL